MRHIGVATSIVAEFWALSDGLILTSQLGITQLFVDQDAKVIVDLVLSTKPSNNSYSSLLNGCRYPLRQFHQIKISHVFRETNMCTDYLAKGGCTLSGNIVVFVKHQQRDVIYHVVYARVDVEREAQNRNTVNTRVTWFNLDSLHPRRNPLRATSLLCIRVQYNNLCYNEP